MLIEINDSTMTTFRKYSSSVWDEYTFIISYSIQKTGRLVIKEISTNSLLAKNKNILFYLVQKYTLQTIFLHIILATYLPLSKDFVLIIFFCQSCHGMIMSLVQLQQWKQKDQLQMFSALPSPWRTLFSEDRADWMEANYLMRTPSVSLSHVSANWANYLWVPQF